MQQTNNLTTYVDYFRQLAVRHKDLLHNPASETGDAPVGSKHFGRYGADEVIGGLRTKMGWPALMVELYENQTAGDSQLAVRCGYAGAFCVYDSAMPEDTNSEEAAYIKCENIMNDILAKINQDHYGPDADFCTKPLGNIDFLSMHIVPVGPIFESQFGWRCEFNFVFNNPANFSEPPAEGTFINP